MVAALTLALATAATASDGPAPRSTGGWSSRDGAQRAASHVQQASATSPSSPSSKLQWQPVRGKGPAAARIPARASQGVVRQAQATQPSVTPPNDPFESRQPAPFGNPQRDPFAEGDPGRPIPSGQSTPRAEPMPIPQSDDTPFKAEPMPPRDSSSPSNTVDAETAESRARSLEDCDEALAELRAKTLSTIELDIRVIGSEGRDFPVECTFGDEAFTPRQWHHLTYAWHASSVCHKPLYFEDVQLERYGHEHGHFLQPAVSALHFFGNLAILPWNMGLKTPDECVYALGHYRPGNCAPYYIDPIGATWRSALFQGAAVTGVVAVIP
jgi:hypothetical protein